MTEQQIDRDRLRALAENATPGPWEDDVDELTDEATVHHDQEQRLWVADCGSKYHAPARADAAFIAASRQAVPALLDMLDQAEQRIRDLTQEVRDERAACLDQIEQVQARDARIQAVEDVLDNPPGSPGGDWVLASALARNIRRALDG